MGELAKGIHKLLKSKRKSQLENWFDQLQLRFKERTLALETSDFIQWGKLTSQLELKGKKAPVIDSLLATQAIRNQLKLITRNTKDFKQFNIDLENPRLE